MKNTPISKRRKVIFMKKITNREVQREKITVKSNDIKHMYVKYHDQEEGDIL